MTDDLLVQAVERLRRLNAYMMPPAPETALSGILCNWLPADYKQFLGMANGCQGPGIRLFGTEPMPLAGGQMEPDLFMATQKAKEDEMISSGHALGRASGGLLIVHNEDANRYEALDESCRDVLYEFTTLAELLDHWLKIAERRRASE